LAAPSEFELIHHHDDQRLRLEGWRQNVGRPVALDLAVPRTDPADGLLVLSWNVWIGRGKLRELVTRIRQGEFTRLGAEPDLPLLILVQEAYRSDSSIPPAPSGRAGRVLVAQLGPQEDVVETARSLQLNLRYAPSMRNGVLRSDRGNAILSTHPLTQSHAIELPLVLQRRVAVSSMLTLGQRQLRVVSAHLDPRGPPGHRWLGASGRELQARHLLSSLQDDTVILGADLNLGRGRYERAWRALSDAGFTFGVPPARPAWRHTFHALPRLVLDYVLVRDRPEVIRQARIHRVDEHPQDRGPRVFGSDHHPLLGRIDFHPAGTAHALESSS
jgi:endonuclease/exonuclease/phosphatase family metal-dependent hydrolase